MWQSLHFNEQMSLEGIGVNYLEHCVFNLKSYKHCYHLSCLRSHAPTILSAYVKLEIHALPLWKRCNSCFKR